MSAGWVARDGSLTVREGVDAPNSSGRVYQVLRVGFEFEVEAIGSALGVHRLAAPWRSGPAWPRVMQRYRTPGTQEIEVTLGAIERNVHAPLAFAPNS